MRSNVAAWLYEQTWSCVGYHYAKQIAAAKQRSGKSRQANVDVGADNEHRCDHKRHERCRQKKDDAVRGTEHHTSHARANQKEGHFTLPFVWPLASRLNATFHRRLPSSCGLLHEPTVYFRVDPVQPLLGAISPVLVIANIGLQFFDLLLGIPKLLRKRLRHIEGSFAVLLGRAGGSMQQTQNGLPCSVELVDLTAVASFRSERNDGLRPVS
jgi:hypothetical protein